MTRDMANWSDWPFVVKLTDKDNHSWTGSVIGANCILTAAHCVVNDCGQKLRCDDISVSISDEKEKRKGKDITGILVHPDYRYCGRGFRNDVALICLETPVRTIKVSLLPEDEEQAYSDGTAATLMGFGGSGGGLWKISANFCRYTNPKKTDFYGADTLAIRATTCHGDSGGPLLIERDSSNPSNERWVQVGVHSLGGDQCGSVDGMGACARTAHPEIWDWIRMCIP